MKIFVRTLTEKTTTVEVKPADSIEVVKKNLRQRRNPSGSGTSYFCGEATGGWPLSELLQSSESFESSFGFKIS